LLPASRQQTLGARTFTHGPGAPYLHLETRAGDTHCDRISPS
jgi:hypothetical protein